MNWFDSREKTDALERAARGWIGTPFFPNSNTPGPQGGVSCQKLCSEIYRAIGFCDINVPEVAMSHAKFSRHSLVEEFMDARQEFRRAGADVTPGDLLGFRFGQIVHHVGIALQDFAFIHAIQDVGVCTSMLSDAAWFSRLERVWRPVKL